VAVSCYQKAAELGDKLAQYNLALMYDGGEGVEVNHAKAVYWYKKSADSGLPEAQINLALCYYWGTGVKKDFKAAYELLTFAGKIRASKRAILAWEVLLFRRVC